MSQSNSKDYEFEHFEKYFGDSSQVVKIIENCPKCGGKLVLTHLSDNGALLMQETARCHACDYGQRKIIHVVN